MKGAASSERAVRWAVASRVVAAALGGYAVTALASWAFSLAMVRWAHWSRVDAAVTGGLASFALYAVCVITVFSVRSATRAWACMAVAGGALFLLALVLPPGGPS